MSKIINSTFQHRMLKIPADWSVYVCCEQCFREAELFILLKCLYGGRIAYSKRLWNETSTIMKVHPKTVQRSLKSLENRKWIGWNHTTNMIYPRSFETIRTVENLPSRKAFVFTLLDLTKTKSFLIAGAISIYILRKEYSLRHGSHRGGPHVRSGHFKSLKMAPVAISNSLVSKFLDISISTASAFKEIAVRAGYIQRERMYIKWPEPIKGTNWTASMIEELYPYYKGRIRAKWGSLYYQGPDQLKTHLIQCKRIGQKPIYNIGHKRSSSYDCK